jgi:hypothetical protein
MMLTRLTLGLLVGALPPCGPTRYFDPRDDDRIAAHCESHCDQATQCNPTLGDQECLDSCFDPERWDDSSECLDAWWEFYACSEALETCEDFNAVAYNGSPCNEEFTAASFTCAQQ